MPSLLSTYKSSNLAHFCPGKITCAHKEYHDNEQTQQIMGLTGLKC